jgi:hypothetical protein
VKSELLTFRRPNGDRAFAPENETERTQAAAVAQGRRTAEAAAAVAH